MIDKFCVCFLCLTVYSFCMSVCVVAVVRTLWQWRPAWTGFSQDCSTQDLWQISRLASFH